MQGGVVYNAGITETHIFNQNLLNELRLSWSRHVGFTFDLRPETYANPLALSPAIGFTSITGYGIPAGTVPQGNYQNTYQLQDSVNWTIGRHSLKAGFDVSDIRIRDAIPWNYYGVVPSRTKVFLAATPNWPTISTISQAPATARQRFLSATQSRVPKYGRRATMPRIHGKLVPTWRLISACATSITARRSTTLVFRASI